MTQLRVFSLRIGGRWQSIGFASSAPCTDAVAYGKCRPPSLPRVVGALIARQVSGGLWKAREYGEGYDLRSGT